MKRELKRILVARECCIGDVLMSTPLLRALRRNFPEARIDYMVGDWSKDILLSNPNVDETIPYLNLRRNSLFQKIVGLLRLRGRGYDLVFVLDVGRGPVLLSRLIGARYRVGFDFNGSGFFLTNKVSRDINDLHEREAFLELGRAIDLKEDSKDMDFPLSGEDLNFAERFLSEHSLSLDRPIVGIFPGGGKNPGTTMPSKRWGEANFSKVASQLIERFRTSVILFGSEADHPVMKRVASGIEGEVTVLLGASLKRLGAVIKKCQIFITNDCGPMHIAAAVGTSTVSIWGPTDPNLLAPSGEEHLVVQTNVKCAPCYKQILGTFEHCQEPVCMNSIDVEDVLKAAQRLMSKTV